MATRVSCPHGCLALMAILPSWLSPPGYFALMVVSPPSWMSRRPHGCLATLMAVSPPSWLSRPHGYLALMLVSPSWLSRPHDYVALMAVSPSSLFHPHDCLGLMDVSTLWLSQPHGGWDFRGLINTSQTCYRPLRYKWLCRQLLICTS